MHRFTGTTNIERIEQRGRSKTPTGIFVQACLLALTLHCGSAFAENEASPQNSPLQGMSPEVVQALLAIDLDKAQRGAFGAEMQKFAKDSRAAITKITRGRNPNKERAIKRKLKSLSKAMDQRMKGILRDDQWAAYESYKAIAANARR